MLLLRHGILIELIEQTFSRSLTRHLVVAVAAHRFQITCFLTLINMVG